MGGRTTNRETLKDKKESFFTLKQRNGRSVVSQEIQHVDCETLQTHQNHQSISGVSLTTKTGPMTTPPWNSPTSPHAPWCMWQEVVKWQTQGSLGLAAIGDIGQLSNSNLQTLFLKGFKGVQLFMGSAVFSLSTHTRNQKYFSINTLEGTNP